MPGLWNGRIIGFPWSHDTPDPLGRLSWVQGLLAPPRMWRIFLVLCSGRDARCLMLKHPWIFDCVLIVSANLWARLLWRMFYSLVWRSWAVFLLGGTICEGALSSKIHWNEKKDVQETEARGIVPCEDASLHLSKFCRVFYFIFKRGAWVSIALVSDSTVV